MVVDKIRDLMTQRVRNGAEGPRGQPDMEAYMAELVGQCDALAMYDGEGNLMWAWSQDGLNGWYWHVDFADGHPRSELQYDYEQSDGSIFKVESEADLLVQFIAGESSVLFFNGQKFLTTQRDTSDEGIEYGVLGGRNGRGLHCAISPGKDCIVLAAASSSGAPSEEYLDLNLQRPKGQIKITPAQLGGMFRAFAPGALGV